MPHQSQLMLFSPFSSLESGFLDVGGGHKLYWEISGNMKGIPVIFMHGGPGAGASPVHRQFFDPSIFKIVIFDQRGAGRSKPLGSLENNQTSLLIEDVEKLRNFLNIDQWHVVGGSWGSTLAIMYASSYPQRCLGLILRGIFLMQPSEIKWFLHDAQQIFPEAWERLANYLPKDKRDNLLQSYYDILTCGEKEVEKEAAYEWSRYESSCSMLRPQPAPQMNDRDWALARIEAHYFLHDDFDVKEHLLKNLPDLRQIPTSIVQGRYDSICPIKTAYWLQKQWPEANMRIVTGGHSMMDPPVCKALLEIINQLKNFL